LNYVTEEDKDRHIKIRPCYIDRIKYQGVQNTNEGLCPVYSGVLYALSSRGDRYDFSFDDHTNDRGVTKYEVNPVRIIYLSEGTLSITSPTGEGLYYYYYNKMTGMDSWELTDREYTKMNESRYALADLYLYQTERMS
jgi:hypothetical protein